jgi:hypothetical protein
MIFGIARAFAHHSFRQAADMDTFGIITALSFSFKPDFSRIVQRAPQSPARCQAREQMPAH